MTQKPRIQLITPAAPQSRAGNRATAVRWARIYKNLGYRVEISVEYKGQPADIMVALHAWRSAAAIAEFAQRFPNRPLIVALTGTDLYRFICSHPKPTLTSIELAHQLVVLHALAYRVIPKQAHPKINVIYQSALPLPRNLPPRQNHFDLCVAGHLRDEKDSLRTAYAVRDLPSKSRLRVLHYGHAHNEAWATAARQEMTINSRYRWYGEVPHWQVRQAFGRCRAMVMSSNMEGGANVVSEAVVANLPVIASDIDGNKGLLGLQYPGYYPVRDTKALRQCLLQAEQKQDYLPSLLRHVESDKDRYSPVREQTGWQRLMNSLGK